MIQGTTKTLGLLGNPIQHTLSPLIHNQLSELMGYDEIYVPFEVPQGELQQAVEGAFSLQILGLNVTVPYKQEVMEYLAAVDPIAKDIGAVNTLVRIPDGYKGYNTDVLGLQRQLREDGISLEGREVIVLGAGGASKAVVYLCYLEKASKVYLLNRTLEKAKRLADTINELVGEILVVPGVLDEYKTLPNRNYIVFQATSIGLPGTKDQAAIMEPEFYEKVQVGIDLIYNPARTMFMQLVEHSGGRAYNGLKMLLYQGICAYEFWNQCTVSDDLAKKVYQKLEASLYPKEQNIVLTGFMGAGKTRIGRELAAQLSFEFIDTDAYIETKEGMTISNIFATKGESYFRALEVQVLHELAKKKGVIISTGGGMPLQTKNAAMLKECGRVIYLQASAETIYQRLKGDTSRPLLQTENPREAISQLLAEREKAYSFVADIAVTVDKKTVEQITKEILTGNETEER